VAVLQENQSVKTSVGVAGIACWLVLSALPVLYQFLKRGETAVLSPAATLEIAYISVTVICALGLLFRQEWARKGVALFFIFYFFWSVWVVNFSMGAYFDPWNQGLAEKFFMPVNELKKITLSMLLIYIFWPVMAVFYLTCPPVKMNFRTKRSS
jgi:hypothetical protein